MQSGTRHVDDGVSTNVAVPDCGHALGDVDIDGVGERDNSTDGVNERVVEPEPVELLGGVDDGAVAIQVTAFLAKETHPQLLAQEQSPRLKP